MLLMWQQKVFVNVAINYSTVYEFWSHSDFVSNFLWNRTGENKKHFILRKCHESLPTWAT